MFVSLNHHEGLNRLSLLWRAIESEPMTINSFFLSTRQGPEGSDLTLCLRNHRLVPIFVGYFRSTKVIKPRFAKEEASPPDLFTSKVKLWTIAEMLPIKVNRIVNNIVCTNGMCIFSTKKYTQGGICSFLLCFGVWSVPVCFGLYCPPPPNNNSQNRWCGEGGESFSMVVTVPQLQILDTS